MDLIPVASFRPIHDYGKDGVLYIFPECPADVNWKLLNKYDTMSPNDEKF